MKHYLIISSLLALMTTLIGVNFYRIAPEKLPIHLNTVVHHECPPPPPPKSPEWEYPIEEELMPVLDEDHIYFVADPMPQFPGLNCINHGSNHPSLCAEHNLLDYVYRNLHYPSEARLAGIEGRAVVQFIVEKNGEITDAKCIRDIGAGCGAEAIRVVNSMSEMKERWIPGRHNGKTVRVRYILPINFSLDS